jgi:protein gp37
MHPDWVRTVRDQCVAAGVPFFWKGWGEWESACSYYEKNDEIRERALDSSHLLLTQSGYEWQVGTPGTSEPHDGQPPPDTWIMRRVGKRAAGRLLDGREWNEMPR